MTGTAQRVHAFLDRRFALAQHGTTVRTELLAGLTTFLTMAYIIFLQPAVLSGALFGMETGMDFGAVMVATCLSAAIATAIMALYARYPIAQAPGMGVNVFFVLTVLPAAAALPAVKSGDAQAWQVALGVVFLSGALFLILSLCRAREWVINAVSPSLKNGIAVGIGIFIAFVGLRNAGVITPDAATAVTLNTDFFSPDLLVFALGLVLTSALHARRVRGAILIGILSTTGLAIVLRLGLDHAHPALTELAFIKESQLMTRFQVSAAVVGPPPSLKPTLFAMDWRQAMVPSMIPLVIVFLFMDLFDTVGTLIGVGEQAGFVVDNRLPRARQALLSDAVGTVAGACLGTSTVTSFIESTAGVEQGGRTGLTALTTAALFLLAPFFAPLVAMVGSYAPITAPALVLVGAMMIRNVTKIDWHDHSECVPAFLVMIGIPFTYSIADGLALGFVSYPLIKLLAGRGRQITRLSYLLGLAVLLYLLFFRSRV